MCKLITLTNYQQHVLHHFYRCDIELTTSPAYGKVVIGTGTVDDSEDQVDVFINQQTNNPLGTPNDYERIDVLESSVEASTVYEIPNTTA